MSGRLYAKQKQNQVNSYSNCPRILLLDLAHKQCSGIGWLHCLMSESKRRFLVNNILIFGSAWFLIISQMQFSLIKKNNWTSRTLANPPPPTSNNILFFVLPPTSPSKWTSYVYCPFFNHISYFCSQNFVLYWFFDQIEQAAWLER